jgi:aerobic-type carbon monoxide dehydrogenase small subunit (CoxS/CutS family)
MAVTITVNGKRHSTKASPDTPLLYVLRNDLRLHGPKFGCGLSQCGACSVLLDGKEIRSCVTPVADVAGKKVTTLEGLPALYAKQKNLAKSPALHPLQQAWIDEQVPQCGYCQNGMIIMAAELLARKSHPTEAEIKKWMNPHLCRCATHNAIVRAIKRAATATA